MSWLAAAAPFAGAALGALASNQKGPNQTTTTNVNQEPWAPTIPYLNEILQRIQAYTNQAPAYTSPDQLVAPLTPEQQAAAGMVTNATAGAQGVVGQGQNAITPFLQGRYMDVSTNPYLKAATDAAIRPITQNYQENVLPGITTAFNVGTDAYDQSREGIAKGIASRGYLDAVGSVAANMANRGYETGLNATQGAIGQIPALTTASTAPGQAQWNIGALLQAQNQQVANAPGAFNQFQQQQLAFPASLYTQIGGIGRSGTNTSTVEGVKGNPYLGAFGGAILGQNVLNLWPKMASGGAGGGGFDLDV